MVRLVRLPVATCPVFAEAGAAEVIVVILVAQTLLGKIVSCALSIHPVFTGIGVSGVFNRFGPLRCLGIFSIIRK